MPNSRKFTVEFKVKAVELAKIRKISSKFEGPNTNMYEVEIIGNKTGIGK